MKNRIKKKFKNILKTIKKVNDQSLIDLHFATIIHSITEEEVINKKAPVGSLFISSLSLRCFVKHGIKDTDWSELQKPNKDELLYLG